MDDLQFGEVINIDEPIVCNLSSEELVLRSQLLQSLGQAVRQTVEIDNGYAYRFDNSDILHQLVDVVDAERRCCTFLSFSIALTPGNGPIWLRITGPQGTREFLTCFFGW